METLPEKSETKLTQPKKAISRMRTENGNTMISLYKDSPLRESTFEAGERLLKETYNNFDDKVSLILLDQLKENGFTNQRFMDAVKHVINTHKYPTITPADILGYDKVMNLRTYKQVAEEGKTYGNSIWSYYKPIDIKGECYYVNIREAELLGINIPEYTPKPATNKTKITGQYKDGERVKKKQMNIADYFKKMNILFETDSEHIKLAKWNRKAQLAWGSDAKAYNEAMEEVERLRSKLNL